MMDLSSPRTSSACSPMKTTTEYEPDDVPLSKATSAAGWAKRCVDIARRVVGCV